MTAYLAGVQERLREAELSRAAESARAGGRGQGVRRAASAAADRRPGRDRAPGRRAGRRRLAVGRAPAARAGAGSIRAGQRRTPGGDPAARPGAGRGGGRPGPLGSWRPSPPRRRATCWSRVSSRRCASRWRTWRPSWRSSGSRPRPPPRRPIATGRCSTGWSTSAVPRPTTGAAGAPTRPTPTPSARRGWTWRHCPRKRRPSGSGPGRPRWRRPWRPRWTTGPPSGAIGRRTAPARRPCRPWPAPPTPTPGASACDRALDLPDPAARLEALRRLAKATPFETLGPVSLDLLGRALKDAGDPAGAEAVLRRAQQRHPGDVWINYDLARALEKLARREEAIRYYTAARSLRPETAHELAHALENKGERDEEIAVFEDLRRLRPGNGRHLGCLGRALKNQGRSQEAACDPGGGRGGQSRGRPPQARRRLCAFQPRLRLGHAGEARMRRSPSTAPPSASSPTTPPSTTTSASSWAGRGSWMRRSPSTAPPSASSPTSPTPTTPSATS